MDGQSYFPLFINLMHKRFYVFGAGKIAAGRITKIMRYGADIVVIAPQIHTHIKKLAAAQPVQLRLQQRAYIPGELQAGAVDFVLAATNDPAVNTQIAKECRQKKIPVNHASDRHQCDYYFPALVEQEQFVLGMISTDGDHASVARVSARLRQEGLDRERCVENGRMAGKDGQTNSDWN